MRSRTPHHAGWTGGLVVLGLALLVARGDISSAAPQGQTRGFYIAATDLGIYYGNADQDCPHGVEMSVEAAYLATKTPEERARLLRPENAREYAKGWKEEFITGPGGENVCNNPKSFMNDPRHPPHRTVQSKVAYGLNLDGTPDGRATKNTCGHQKFAGVNGEPGVDNQLYRAVGCSKMWRSSMPYDGAWVDPFLVEIRGLDDPMNDEHVDVGIYSTDDTPIQGSDGQALPNQTLGITRNPRWRANVAGRIVNGTLTTDKVAVINLHHVLPTWGPLGTDYDFEFHGAQLRMSFQQGGTLSGVLAAYRPLDNIFTVGRC